MAVVAVATVVAVAGKGEMFRFFRFCFILL